MLEIKSCKKGVPFVLIDSGTVLAIIFPHLLYTKHYKKCRYPIFNIPYIKVDILLDNLLVKYVSWYPDKIIFNKNETFFFAFRCVN